jgi:ABC-type arginine transport system ATPase subunit
MSPVYERNTKVTKTEITKRIVSIVVGLGTTKIVNDIVENNTDTETTADKVKVKASSLVIGAMAADATSEYTNRKIDEITAWWNLNVAPRLNKDN